MPKIAIPIAGSYEQLVSASNPGTVNAPESIPYWFYDTQLYTSAATTTLTFFAASQAALDLGNLPIGGNFPDPNFFAVHYINVDCMQNAAGTPYTTTAAIGAALTNANALNDVGSLILSGRGRITLTLSDKRYGPWPLSVTGGTGAALGFSAVAGLTGAGNAQRSDFGYNALHGGAYLGGKVIVPPKVGFNVVLDWPAALTLTGNYQIRTTLYGVYYRRVL